MNKQAALFLKNHLDRDAGLNLVHEICLNLFNEEFTEDDGMFSEHLVICSSLSLSSDFKANNILEIGTFDGRTAAIVTGIFLGGLLGKDVGATLDRVDKQMMARTTHNTLENSPIGSTSNWNNPDTGNSGTITPTKTYRCAGTSCASQTTSGYCREFQTTVTVGGKVQNAYGTACRQPDGSWKIVN